MWVSSGIRQGRRELREPPALLLDGPAEPLVIFRPQGVECLIYEPGRYAAGRVECCRLIGFAVTAVTLVTATSVQAQPNRIPWQTGRFNCRRRLLALVGFPRHLHDGPRTIVSYPADHKPGTS